MSARSLQKRHRLRDRNLNRKITEIHLDQISHSCCAQWKRLPVYLGMKNIVGANLSAIVEEDKRHLFLFKWREARGTRATYRRLIKALLKIDCVEDAEIVCKLIQPHPRKRPVDNMRLQSNTTSTPRSRQCGDDDSPVHTDVDSVFTLVTSDTAPHETSSESDSSLSCRDTVVAISPEVLNRRLTEHELMIIAAQNL